MQMARRWHGKGSARGREEGASGWGRIRRLPSSGRYQANYVGPDRVRHNALTTFEAKMDAEAWLAAQRRSIDRDEWQPPSLVTEPPQWVMDTSAYTHLCRAGHAYIIEKLAPGDPEDAGGAQTGATEPRYGFEKGQQVRVKLGGH
jgi:hypothetical protein